MKIVTACPEEWKGVYFSSVMFVSTTLLEEQNILLKPVLMVAGVSNMDLQHITI